MGRLGGASEYASLFAARSLSCRDRDEAFRSGSRNAMMTLSNDNQQGPPPPPPHPPPPPRRRLPQRERLERFQRIVRSKQTRMGVFIA